MHHFSQSNKVKHRHVFYIKTFLFVQITQVRWRNNGSGALVGWSWRGKPHVPIEKLVPVPVLHSKFQEKWPGIELGPSNGKVGEWSTDPWRSLESAGSSIVCYWSRYNTRLMLRGSECTSRGPHGHTCEWNVGYSQPSQATKNSDLSQKFPCRLCFRARYKQQLFLELRNATWKSGYEWWIK